MKINFLCLIIFVSLFSCKNNKVDDIDYDQLWQCNKAQNPDSLSLSKKLVGSWNWRKQFCFWAGETTLANKNINVTFNGDNTFCLKEDAKIIAQGNWRLEVKNTNSWGLDLSSSSTYSGEGYFNGYISLCNNQLLFNHSYIDGCDNLFERYTK